MKCGKRERDFFLFAAAAVPVLTVPNPASANPP